MDYLPFLDLLIPQGARATTGSDLPQGHRCLTRHLVIPSLGRPKLVVPEAALTPSLSLWRPGRRATRTLLGLLRVAARAGALAHLPWPRVTVSSAGPCGPSPLDKALESLVFDQWAAAPGTPGPFRKVAIRLFADERIAAHVKAGEGRAGERVRHEVAVLRQVAELGQGPFVIPRLLEAESAGVWQVAAFEQAELSRVDGLPMARVAQLARALHGQGAHRARLTETSFWRSFEDRLDRHGLELDRKAHQLCRAKLGNRSLRVGLVHGDFAPYNMGRVAGGRIFLFDWEMACCDGPELFDFLHWTLFVPLLMKAATPSRLIRGLRTGAIRRATQDHANLHTLALLYLMDRLTRLRQEQDLSPSLLRRTQIEALEVIALALVESSR